MGGKKGKGKKGDSDEEWEAAKAGGNAKGYVSLQEIERKEKVAADNKDGPGAGEEAKKSKKNKKKGKGGEEAKDGDEIQPKRSKKAQEDDAAFDDAKEEKKGDAEVVKPAAKGGDSDSDDAAAIEKQKAEHFVGVDSKNTRKKKKQEQKMYGAGDELAGAFDEDAGEDEVHAKKGKGDKKSKKREEKDAKYAAGKAAKKNKRKEAESDEEDEPAEADDKKEEEKKEEAEGAGGVFKDIGKAFGKDSKKDSKKKGKKDKGEAADKSDPPEESKVAAEAEPETVEILEEPVSEYPVNVVYCAKCGVPPEYCSYSSKDLPACKDWLQGTSPVLYRELYGGDADAGEAKVKTKGAEDGEEQKVPADGEGGEEGEAAPKKKINKKDGFIHVYKLKRGGKKIQCLITGLDFYSKDLKALCSKFQKKFACGAATAQDEQYGACIQIQGDIEENLLNYIEEDKDMQKLEIPIAKLIFEEKGNKKGRKQK